MKVSGQHDFSHSRDEVWNALMDPVALAAAMPGARRLEPTGPDEYMLVVDVGVGSVKGTYDGTFALTDKLAPESCTVRASASGRPGSVAVVATMSLGEDARLLYEADATVTGPLAGVGQRLMAAAARRTTEQFLAALDAQIGAPADAIEAEPELVGGHVYAIEPARPVDNTRMVVTSALAGFLLALVGVAVGRWTARR